MEEDTQWEKSLKEASDRALSTVYFPEKSKTKMGETAVELLKEWRKLKMDIETDSRLIDNPVKFVVPAMEKAEVLSRRLDEMCEAAGISIVDNEFAYNSDNTEWRLLSDGGHIFINLPTREQQALQEWLLIKEGK